jgi:hypothetical protein
MGLTVATECLSEHMTALKAFSCQLVAISWRLITEVLGLGLIPVQKRRADGRGRPLKHDARAVLNGVLWVLRTGAAWAGPSSQAPDTLNPLQNTFDKI